MDIFSWLNIFTWLGLTKVGEDLEPAASELEEGGCRFCFPGS